MLSTMHQISANFFINRIKDKQPQIHQWLKSLEQECLPPIYSSVDIRDAGFKIAVVDTNLFPAGFNNLCEHGIEDSIKFIRKAINRRVPNCENILIVAEEHTRNTWYLENIRVLQQIIEKAGFRSRVATFFNIEPEFCQSASAVDLETATGETVKIFCFKRILQKIKEGQDHYDLLILNNDLSTGIPTTLLETGIPIYPSARAGWHSRLKSRHFTFTEDLIKHLAQVIDIDPWMFSALFSTVDSVDINNDRDRQKLADSAAALFASIQKKYTEHGIEEKPFIFLKSDYGTYGMGVTPIESPQEIIDMNRKIKNKLYKGKSSQVISKFLLQEGVPTIYEIDNKVSEVCIYQIDNNLVGGFYRMHSEKSSRQNLNSQGMEFKKMCPHQKKYGDCGIHHDLNIFDIYRLLARIAGVAARKEIIELEKAKSA